MNRKDAALSIKNLGFAIKSKVNKFNKSKKNIFRDTKGENPLNHKCLIPDNGKKII
jgi:hypothetical protein